LLAGLCAAAPACRGADPSATAAAEPPPPLIEPELAPGSRLVDPRPDELVRQMSDRLARSPAFLGIHEAAGVPCHHLSFEQATIDWQIVGGAAVGAAIGAIAGGGQDAAIGAAVGAGAGGVAPAASSVQPAVIAAQSPQAFTLAVPLTVEIMTNVAVS
jgi:hypothetical protein